MAKKKRPSLRAKNSHPKTGPGILNAKTAILCATSIVIALVVGLVALGLIRLIAFFTNLSFYHRLSFETVSPADNGLGLLVILVPVVGGVIVGLMACWG
ncbi:MAG TPA: chloride channel protein, partial [bacterium]|nr:chloride channel protein [bacterium]